MLRDKIELAIGRISSLSERKSVRIISHFDADGITSAAIFARAMQRMGKRFSLQIIKGLEEEFVKSLSEKEILIFLDLASNSLNVLREKETEVFVFDHHEITQDVPENVLMINPFLDGGEMLSSSGVCYLFAKMVSLQNTDLANLAVIGMIGDMFGKSIGKIFSEILSDAESVVKKGLLIYPSTRPLDRALEYSSSPYIPGISGSRKGVVELLRDAGLSSDGGKYKALYELSEEEMTRLVTTILLKNNGKEVGEDIIGNLFLLKFFNKLEDARELSALINACSRMDRPEVALGFCLGNKDLREEAENIYIDYKQSLVGALKYVSESEKVFGKDYMIINARDKVKDTIIGTIASIVSHSPLYPEGLLIVALAYNEDKIKVSARIAGRRGRNVRDILSRAIVPIGGEVGGHSNAAGCLISKDREDDFIRELRKILDVEMVKV